MLMLSRLRDKAWVGYRAGVERLPERLAVETLLRVMPRHFDIEATNLCNHHCPLCPNPVQTRPRGRMDPAAFAELAQEIRPFAANLCLSLLGESLLNPGIFDIIASAEGLGIPCALTTNGLLLDESIDQVFESGLSSLKIAVDGADRESHERYRIGGDFDRVRAAVERVCAEKRRRGATRPLISVLSLIFRHNDGQQDEIRRWAKSVGVDRVGFKPVWIGGGRYLGLDEEELAATWLPENPELHHESYLQENLCRRWRVCPALHMAAILWNGDVVPCGRCAVDGRDVFGNVFTDGGFRAVWGSDRHREVITRILREENDLCEGCDTPLGGKWLHKRNGKAVRRTSTL